MCDKRSVMIASNKYFIKTHKVLTRKEFDYYYNWFNRFEDRMVKLFDENDN
jgi:hypothetical protein